MTGVGALATALIALLAAPYYHEGTKQREAHEASLDKAVLRGLHDTSWLRDKSVVMQAAPAPRTIDKGDHTYIVSPRQVVIRTDDELSALWREHIPDRPQPPVDFSREMVVGVFLGSKPTAAYSVAIVSTIEANGVLQVRYRISQPPSGVITAQVISFPYHLAAIRKSSAKEVKFEKIPNP
jgi:hypothetical protein